MSPRRAAALALLAVSVTGLPCPPPGFQSVKEFSVSTYISQPWFIIQQAPNSYQPVDKLFCVRCGWGEGERSRAARCLTRFHRAEYHLVEHALDSADPDKLQVFNQARTGSVDGPPDGVDMLLSAVVVDGARGQLKVGPAFLPDILYGPYWVNALGETEAGGNLSYSWALVSGGPPTYEGKNGKCRNAQDQVEGVDEGLWIFSRTPTMGASTLAQIRALAEQLGFDISILLDVVQKGCEYAPFPDPASPPAKNRGVSVPRSLLRAVL